MIIDQLSDLVESNALNPKLQSKLNFLKETDFSKYPVGRHEMDGESYFVVIEYETKPVEDCFWEAHQKYLDIQYYLEGTEKMAVDHIDRQKVKEQYNEEKDMTIYEGEVDSVVTMNPGDVAVLFPEDSHMPSIIAKEKQKVRKIVIKAKI